MYDPLTTAPQGLSRPFKPTPRLSFYSDCRPASWRVVSADGWHTAARNLLMFGGASGPVVSS